MNVWTVPEEWPGATFFILGGGPSLKGFDAEVLRGRGRVIAVNEAGLAVNPGDEDALPRAPWADVLYWADPQFLAWNHDRLQTHQGRYKITRHQPEVDTGLDIKLLPQSDQPLAVDRRSLSGFCGGGAAINLAYLLGAKRIVLLGFDMKGNNWHSRHRRSIDKDRYRTHFMPPIAKMAWPLKERGVEVINCTPDSALTCFPFARLDDVLSDLPPGATSQTEADDGIAEKRPEAGDPVPVCRGLELRHRPELNRHIERLAKYDRLRVVVRLLGGDVLIQRSSAWWQQQLSLAFREVLIEDEEPKEVTFICRRM